MKHIQEFDRFAKSYQNYKIIQSKVAKYLVEKTTKRGKHIVDLGAGSGEVYRAIDWEFKRFFAVDLAANMLSLHPTKGVKKILCDFDSDECFAKLSHLPIDQVFASSSLQWSKDLDRVFKNIASLSDTLSCALFTSNTFSTIHNMLGISSPVPSAEKILAIARRYFMVNYEIKVYKLFFPNRRLIFDYIKKSGVSSGKKRANIADLRRLMQTYPHSYLEFEVVFLWCEK